jgi:hypothetical protein
MHLRFVRNSENRRFAASSNNRRSVHVGITPIHVGSTIRGVEHFRGRNRWWRMIILVIVVAVVVFVIGSGFPVIIIEIRIAVVVMMMSSGANCGLPSHERAQVQNRLTQPVVIGFLHGTRRFLVGEIDGILEDFLPGDTRTSIGKSEKSSKKKGQETVRKMTIKKQKVILKKELE